MKDTDIFQQAVEQLETGLDCLRFAVSRFNEAGLFYGHGTNNSEDEALQLLLFSLHLPYAIDADLLKCKLTQVERKNFIELIKQRIEKRMPAAYLTHSANFAGLEFYVDERVLVPRSPIAELINEQFSPWVGPEQVEKILDLCTGSACIAIACAYAFPEAKVDAVDIDPKALAVAQKNVAKHALEEQVNLIQSDLWEKISGKYDLIVSNPPYVSAEEMQTLPNEYYHEPQHGLFAEQEGLAFAIKILNQAAKHLNENGVLIVEVGNSAELLQETYPQVPFCWLEFANGGQGVFLLTKEQIVAHFSQENR